MRREKGAERICEESGLKLPIFGKKKEKSSSLASIINSKRSTPAKIIIKLSKPRRKNLESSKRSDSSHTKDSNEINR